MLWMQAGRRKRWRMLMTRGVLCVACMSGLQAGAAPKPPTPKPEVRIPLADLGHPGISSAFLNAGASVLTVNFVDSDHLLVTFATRSLVPRMPDAQPDDQDEIVAAQLISLPSGKVVASTRWHLHDHGRYLWSLGDGRFLFRSRELLSTFAPMANLASGHPFERVSFPHRRGNLLSVDVSPDHRLVTMETAMPVPKPVMPHSGGAGTGPQGGGVMSSPPPVPMITLGDGPAKPDVRVNVLRIAGTGSVADPISVNRVANLRADGQVSLPVDGEGYLDEEERPRNHWTVSFYEFGGTVHPLAAVDSGCPPDLQMVSPSQYVSMTCRGMQGGKTLTAFDLDKHYIWEEPLGVLAAGPSFAYAPAAGRFAISRRTSGSAAANIDGTSGVTPTQDLRVYQTQTGDLLLKVACDPVFVTPENFDLTADGMRAVLVRGGAIEVYRLPELTKLDRQDLADLEKVTPRENNSARVNLARLLTEEEAEIREAAALPGTPVESAGQASTKTAASATFSEAPVAAERIRPPDTVRPVLSGDADEGPRKPPTLLLPGEKAEMKVKDEKPK